MLTEIGQFALGLLVLVAGAEALIRGAVRVARALGVSPFVIGFTLIGFGTSAPELVVCLSAAWNGSPQIALGNIVGRNVANVGLILGLAAVVRPLTARMQLLRIEVPMMLGASLLVWFLAGDKTLSREDGIVLLAGFLAVAIYTFRTARRETPVVKEEVGKSAASQMPVWGAACLVAVGLAGLVGGAELMVSAAVHLAKGWGVSEWLIGLTVVAVGTSLPELAASVVAAARGQSDIALGNVVGSNVFNILLVLGVTVVVNPMRLSNEVVTRDIPAMALFAVLMLPVLMNGLKVHRYEGGFLLVAYTGFVVWQVNK